MVNLFWIIIICKIIILVMIIMISKEGSISAAGYLVLEQH